MDRLGIDSGYARRVDPVSSLTQIWIVPASVQGRSRVGAGSAQCLTANLYLRHWTLCVHSVLLSYRMHKCHALRPYAKLCRHTSTPWCLPHTAVLMSKTARSAAHFPSAFCTAFWPGLDHLLLQLWSDFQRRLLFLMAMFISVIIEWIDHGSTLDRLCIDAVSIMDRPWIDNVSILDRHWVMSWSTMDRHWIWIDSGSTRDRPWIDPASILDRPQIDYGSTMDRPWIDPGSTLDRHRIDGSALDRPWVDTGSFLG